MKDLDHMHDLAVRDPGGMGKLIAQFPEECARAWKQASAFSLPATYRSPRAVVVLAMGGSAISGDLARTLAQERTAASINVVRDYRLPGYVDADTLVLAISYSGNTEETIAAFQAAKARGARLVAITSGGQLAQVAKAAGAVLYPVDSRFPQPRAALPHLLMPTLQMLAQASVSPDPAPEIPAALDLLRRKGQEWGLETPEQSNLAKQLARRLHGRIAVIYGAEFLSEVARRWKTQLNENSKHWAFFEHLPELNHNAIVGYEFPPHAPDSICVVQLASRFYHARTAARLQITAELLERARIPHTTIAAEADSPLAQQLFALLLGDWVSYYLALLNGVDPTSIPAISELKARLQQVPMTETR